MLCLTAFPTPHDRLLRDGYCLRRPSRPRHPFSDNKVASRGSQMTRRAFGMPCSWPSDGVITPPAGQPPGPGPSGGHEKHPGADLCFSALNMTVQKDGHETVSVSDPIVGDATFSEQGVIEGGNGSYQLIVRKENNTGDTLNPMAFQVKNVCETSEKNARQPEKNQSIRLASHPRGEAHRTSPLPLEQNDPTRPLTT